MQHAHGQDPDKFTTANISFVWSKTVAYDEGRDLELKKELFLGDALSDLPSENVAAASPLSLCLILLMLSIPVHDGRISNVLAYRNNPHALFFIARSESNTVAYDEGKDLELKKELFLGDALSDIPLGDVDVVCGEPPCKGISGFNRFRNKENPMQDSNFLGMNYQARVRMMAAGAYGLPQFRMRVFMFGALSSEKLPQYPLPTHKVIVRGVIRTEFEDVELKKELFLGDALSDTPLVLENSEPRDEMSYTDEVLESVLYDHRPLQLNDDDHQRVCQIPKRKGANFRDLTGVRVWPDKKVEWDRDVERVFLPSGKPLVPDYSMSFVGGSSSKSFGCLWWDETVSTVVRRAEPHNQASFYLCHLIQSIELACVFGNREDAHEVQTIARMLNLNVNFMKGRDHANDSLHRYEPFS
ncbi:hypothetical protein CQW23_22151 [Capsicum baccatum]|uniref:Uncharacterized protein n=1 Tax=Capsicum baccatum TaxID=33114 RepID=A0A2G2W022_CAPBA|nr:hypothetical protein CQW23_22151 [Capsicum baccatum]